MHCLDVSYTLSRGPALQGRHRGSTAPHTRCTVSPDRYRGTSLMRNLPFLGLCSRTMPRAAPSRAVTPHARRTVSPIRCHMPHTGSNVMFQLRRTLAAPSRAATSVPTGQHSERQQHRRTGAATKGQSPQVTWPALHNTAGASSVRRGSAPCFNCTAHAPHRQCIIHIKSVQYM